MFVFAVRGACAAEYELSPRNMDGSKAEVAVYCMTPVGWQGWKEDPHYWDGVTGLNRELLEGANKVGAFFLKPECKQTPRCPSLSLDTIGSKPGQETNVHVELRKFVRQVQQHQKLSDAEPTVTRFGSFKAGANGRLTIWRIHCSYYNDCLLTVLVQHDVAITIYLEAREAKQILHEVDSLKMLAASVRTVPR